MALQKRQSMNSLRVDWPLQVWTYALAISALGELAKVCKDSRGIAVYEVSGRELDGTED